MPFRTACLFKQFRKPPLSLKQFILRSEIIKLYRSFMRLGRLMEDPASPSKDLSSDSISTGQTSSKASRRTPNPLQLEWTNWVRSEFRLRQVTDDEEVIRMMIAQGRRQLQEMERTISLANNRNLKSNAANNFSCAEKSSK